MLNEVNNPGNPVVRDFFVLWILRVSQSPKAPHIRISPADQLHECLEVPGIESVAGIACFSYVNVRKPQS